MNEVEVYCLREGACGGGGGGGGGGEMICVRFMSCQCF